VKKNETVPFETDHLHAESFVYFVLEYLRMSDVVSFFFFFGESVT